MIRLVTAALAAWFIAAFIYIAIRSMPYPFHLEWMEGQNIDVIQRVVSGQPIYVEPSLEYVPFIYTPYYYYVAAFVALFTGVDFLPGRLVSFLAALGIGGILFAWVRKDGGSRSAALTAAGLFYATYQLSGRWFDAARIDSLFLMLTLAGLFVFVHYRGFRPALAAAVLLACAFFTKQSALIIALPALLAGLWYDRRQALMTGGMLAALLAAGIFAWDAASDGWFSFYVFKVPAGHDINHHYFMGFWQKDMLRHLGILCAVAAAALGFRLIRQPGKGLMYAALAAGFIGASYVSRIHSYGYINVLMPAHAFLALMAGLALSGCEGKKNVAAAALVSILAAAQMALLAYNPLKLIPGAEAVQMGNRFLEQIAHIDGDVFIPELQFVQKRVGKKSYDFGMAAFDIFRSDLKDRNDVKIKLEHELQEALATKRFDAVIEGQLIKTPGLRKYYKFQERTEYPTAYVTGAINFLRIAVFVRIPDRNPP